MDGQINNLKKSEEKSTEKKLVLRPNQLLKKKSKKRESVIRRLQEKQISIAVKSGKPVPRHWEQPFERRK